MDISQDLKDAGWVLLTPLGSLGVLYRKNGFDDRLLVSFDQLSAYNYGRIRLSGDGLAVRCEADHLHLTTSKNEWFQSPELCDVIAVMQEICSRYADVILYGQSMGGYAALIFSKTLGATNVVAFAPQFSVDPKRVPFEDRFNGYVANTEFVYDSMEETISNSASKYIIYDPYTKLDKMHVDLIRKHPMVVLIPIPFSGHLPGEMLKDGGCLSDVVTDLLLSRANVEERRLRIRSARRHSPRYFLERAVHLGRRRDLKAAFRAISRAYLLNPKNIAVMETLSCVLMFDNSYYGLAHIILRFILHERPDLKHYEEMQDLVWREMKNSVEINGKSSEPDTTEL